MPDKKMSVLMAARQLGSLSSRWMDPRDGYRLKAVRSLVTKAGYSPKMAHAALDATFSELTEKALIRLLRTEIGDPRSLDGFRRDPHSGHLCYAKAPDSILHIFSSNIPNAAIWSLVMGLLIQSKNFLKPSREDAGVLDIYISSLRSASPALFDKVKRLPSRHEAVKPYLKKVKVVICYGDDDTVASMRQQADPKSIFVGYGHRASLAIILKEALTQKNAPILAAKLARDAWMVDGRGCLSPLAIYVQAGGSVSAEDLEGSFRKELVRLRSESQADFSARTRSLMSSLRVPVIPFRGLEALLRSLAPRSAHLQAVALECGAKQRLKLALQLSSIGVNRICRAGTMQHPPITWHHDGRPNIASWLTWTDLE